MDWWQVSVRVPARDAASVMDALATLGDDVATAADLPFEQPTPEEPATPLPDALATVSAYFAATPRSAKAERDALRLRANAALRPFDARARIRRLREHDWIAATKAAFPLMRIGQRIVVRPVWEAYDPRPGEAVVVLDPGIAFGTGAHETTRTCLEVAERLVRPGARVLDLGCGSGILAIAAARLGARTVWALDIDPFAVDAARSNAALNALDGTIVVREGSLGDAAPHGLPAAFDTVFANIASAPLIALATPLAQALVPGGTLVASGVLAEHAAPVRRAIEAAALRVDEVIAAGDWRTIVAQRPPG